MLDPSFQSRMLDSWFYLNMYILETRLEWKSWPLSFCNYTYPRTYCLYYAWIGMRFEKFLLFFQLRFGSEQGLDHQRQCYCTIVHGSLCMYTCIANTLQDAACTFTVWSGVGIGKLHALNEAMHHLHPNSLVYEYH